MYNVQHAVVVPSKIKSQVDRDLYQSWMLYYQRGHYVKQSTKQHPFVFAQSVDDILDIIKNKDTEYLILTWFGIYSGDFWNIHTLCIAEISRHDDNWSVLNNNNEKSIQIVNVKKWREQGCPKFIDFANDAKPISNNILNKLLDTKAIENPLAWNEELKLYTQLPLIQTDNTALLTMLLATRNIRHANNDDKGVFFLYNTEAICTDKQHLHAVQGAINTVVGPCSMFKAFILGSKYIDNVENYLHFDIFERNLRWKKLITKFWDGTKEGLLQTLKICADDGDGDYSFWNNSQDNIIEKQWSVLLEEFSSEEEITKHWNIYKSKNHEYALANMLFDDTQIVAKLKKFNIKGIYYAIGDIPGFRNNALQYGLLQINQLTSTHINRVASVNSNLYCDIKVPASDLQKFKKYEDILEDLQKDYDLFSFEEYSE